MVLNISIALLPDPEASAKLPPSRKQLTQNVEVLSLAATSGFCGWTSSMNHRVFNLVEGIQKHSCSFTDQDFQDTHHNKQTSGQFPRTV